MDTRASPALPRPRTAPVPGARAVLTTSLPPGPAAEPRSSRRTDPGRAGDPADAGRPVAVPDGAAVLVLWRAEGEMTQVDMERDVTGYIRLRRL